MGSFKDWGIEIRVSFRENTKAQVLSARVQSGGERSVSTIMYLMALQEMMVSPFRCVDEINQGLDDRNERLVFKRIVENSTRPPVKGPTDHCGQYFLITPKLLPNLTDMDVEAMTVLSIFNGTFVGGLMLNSVALYIKSHIAFCHTGPYNFKSPSDWDIPHLLSLRTKREIPNEAADDEENIHNSQPDAIPRKSKAKKARTSLED
jgi:hypothetical protein